jgi:hypothetical protein
MMSKKEISIQSLKMILEWLIQSGFCEKMELKVLTLNIIDKIEEPNRWGVG